MKNNIVLIGFMGSGKSVVAKELKRVSGFDLLDTDELISQKYQLSISEIFTQKGESFFRDAETHILQTLTTVKETIISTGGGIVLKSQNQDLLHQIGQIFWLDGDAETFYERLKNNTTRPLLAKGNKLEKIKQILQSRGPVYKITADHNLDTRKKSPSEIAVKIWQIYNNRSN